MVRIYICFGSESRENAHRLLNMAICEGFDIRAEALISARGANGKPYLPERQDIRFNISHSGDYAVAAISDEYEVGVDIERTPEDSSRVKRICERYLDGCAPEEFLRGWTRRESYGKLTGEGFFAKSRNPHTFVEHELGEYLLTLCLYGACAPEVEFFTVSETALSRYAPIRL